MTIARYTHLQMIFTGDFYQLPPVERYKPDTIEPDFAFNAACWDKMIPTENCFFLQTAYRQKDAKFADVLNRLRFGELTEEDMAELDKRVIPDEDVPDMCSEL
jgi:ATP-dependent DNA helicase PIF1